jgi:GTPase
MDPPVFGMGETPNTQTATVTIRRGRIQSEVPQTRIAVAGHLRAGKSTLVGVICTGGTDNGHGSARNAVLQYNHEFESGHTSSITTHEVCFDHDGAVLRNAPISASAANELASAAGNEKLTDGDADKVLTSSEVPSRRYRSYSNLELTDERITNKSVSLIDLAGHEKVFFRYTIFITLIFVS